MSLAGLLVWLYVVARILSTGTIPDGVTVLGIHLSFWIWGIVAFLASFAFMVLFVIASGFSRRGKGSERSA